MKPHRIACIVVGITLVGLALIVSLEKRNRGDASWTSLSENQQTADKNQLPISNQNKIVDGGAEISASDAQSAGRNKSNEVRPPDVTMSSNRSRTDPGQKRLSVIDPMASWDESPAWPEGPRLFAEVETSGKRYVNLRPNDIGLLPQLNVNPKEILKITLQMPEATGGERIHVELPNGGKFADQEETGKTLIVDQKRSIHFTMEADETMGNCTLHIRQAGHTRTLPLWIGEPPILATGDDDS